MNTPNPFLVPVFVVSSTGVVTQNNYSMFAVDHVAATTARLEHDATFRGAIPMPAK